MRAELLLCPKCQAPLRARVEEVTSVLIFAGEGGEPLYSTFDGEVLESNVLEVFCPWCGWKASWEQARQEAARGA